VRNDRKLRALADRMASLKPSPTLSLNALAQSMQKQGIDVINLTAGETDFPTPSVISEAAITALRAGKTRYTPAHGVPALRKKVTEWFSGHWGLKYSEKQVTVTAGVKQGIFNLALASLNPGDEVLIPAPYWVSYPAIIEVMGAKSIILPTSPDDGFRLDPELVRKAIGPKTRWLILNFPNNPTGAIASREDLQKIAKILEGTEILVISDEIYADLSYSKDQYCPFASISEDAFRRTITMNGLSKSHAMTGWRVGFIAGDEALIEAMGTIQGQSLSNLTTFVQDAAIEALGYPLKEIHKMRDSLGERRDFALSLFAREKRIKLAPPPGAFYLFPDFSAWYGKRTPSGMAISDSISLSDYLLREALVAVVPGSAFGEDRCLRLSFATDKKSIEKGIARILEALEKLT
jgi:aspartate aminotransferase